MRERPKDTDTGDYPRLLAEARMRLGQPGGAPADVHVLPPEDLAFQKKLVAAMQVAKELAQKVAKDPMVLASIENEIKKQQPDLEALYARRSEEELLRVNLMLTYYWLAIIRLRHGKPAEADELLNKGQPLADLLTKQKSDNPRVPGLVAEFQSARGWAWLGLGKLDQAERIFGAIWGEFADNAGRPDHPPPVSVDRSFGLLQSAW